MPLTNPVTNASDPGRPSPDEYGQNHERYIGLVTSGNILVTLAAQVDETLETLRGVSEADALRRQPPYHWSLMEVVGHVTDAERVFAYRAMRIARNDPTPLPSFDENDYVAQAKFDARPLSDLVDEFSLVRRSTLALLQGLDAVAWVRRGTVSGTSVSVRAIAYVIAGHERHHAVVLAERVKAL